MSDTKEEFYATIKVPIDREIINQAVWGCEGAPWFPKIRYEEDGEENVTSVNVTCWDQNGEEGEIGSPITLTSSDIANAIGDIVSGKHGDGWCAREIRDAVLQSDAGNIDATGSEVILQVACYGDIIYG